jgi:hypothetical protein
MTGNSPENLQLVLTAEEGTGKIVVSMEAFFEFSFELAEDLEDLVARWRHVAAPRASSTHRGIRD